MTKTKYIRVSVVPRSKNPEVLELEKNYLKVKLTSPPIRNRANVELVDLLAEYYGVHKSTITIKKGHHSRKKLIEITDNRQA